MESRVLYLRFNCLLSLVQPIFGATDLGLWNYFLRIEVSYTILRPFSHKKFTRVLH